MSFHYLADCHVHTDCSPDGADSAMMMCESAVRLGYYAVCLTDHCECNEYASGGYDRSSVQAYYESKKAAAVFRSRLHVHTGVELGQPLQNLSAAEKVLERFPYDFVLGSLHNVEGLKDFWVLDVSTSDVETVLDRYFDEILRMIEWGKFHSLAHLTYPWRYIVGERGIPVDDKRFSEKIDRILMALIEKNIALELNTSGFRQKIGVSMPDFPVLLRYRELGGGLVTVGSDAHRWADVGGGIERGLGLLYRAGFRHYAVYVGGKPKLLPID